MMGYSDPDTMRLKFIMKLTSVKLIIKSEQGLLLASCSRTVNKYNVTSGEGSASDKKYYKILTFIIQS